MPIVNKIHSRKVNIAFQEKLKTIPIKVRALIKYWFIHTNLKIFTKWKKTSKKSNKRKIKVVTTQQK